MKFTRPSVLAGKARRIYDQTGGNDDAHSLMKGEIEGIAAVLNEDQTMDTVNSVAGTAAGSLEEFFDSDGATTDILAVTTGAEGEVDLMVKIYEALYDLWKESQAAAGALGCEPKDPGRNFVQNVKATYEGSPLPALRAKLRTLRSSLARRNDVEVAEEIDSIRAYLAIRRHQ